MKDNVAEWRDKLKELLDDARIGVNNNHCFFELFNGTLTSHRLSERGVDEEFTEGEGRKRQ